MSAPLRASVPSWKLQGYSDIHPTVLTAQRGSQDASNGHQEPGWRR